MKWKSPRWISTLWYYSTPFHGNFKAFNAAPTSRVMLTYGMFTVAANDCKYSTCCWIVENFQQWEICFICFHRVLIGTSFFMNLGQRATKCCNSLVMWIPFRKAKPKEKQEVKYFGDIGALFYVIKLRRLLGFVDDRIRNVTLLMFNSSTFETPLSV